MWKEKLIKLNYRNMFPENIMRATFSQVETSYVDRVSIGADGNNITKVELDKKFIEGIDVLGMSLISILTDVTSHFRYHCVFHCSWHRY